jgi:hypothetical protein
VNCVNDLSIHLTISQLSELTGRDRRTVAKQLSDLKHTAGEGGAMLHESAEALPLVYGVDNLATARAEQARSQAQLNAIRGEDLRKTRIPITIVLQVHDEIFQALAATLKSVLPKSGVWVRLPSSAPLITQFC